MTSDLGPQNNPGESAAWRILLVEDNPDDADLCSLFLRKVNRGTHIEVVNTQEAFAERLGVNSYDVVLSDYALGSWTGLDVLKLLRAGGREIPFILVTGALGEERAVECIKNGISDYILKDRLERLPLAISKALDEKRLREERERAERSLEESEAKFRTLAESLPAATFIQQGTRCCYVNHAAELITGYSKEEFEEITFWQLVHPDSKKSAAGQIANGTQNGFRYELKVLTKKGEVRWLDVTLSMFNHDGALASLITAFDISERKNAEEGYGHDLATDPLTGLPDHRRFADVFQTECKRSEQNRRPCALLLLELDSLSRLNEEHGPHATDEALCRVARILLQCRAADTPARLREGEFAVVLPDTSPQGAQTMGARIAEKIERDAKGPALSCRFATAAFAEDGKNVYQLLETARQRLQSPERHGRKESGREDVLDENATGAVPTEHKRVM